MIRDVFDEIQPLNLVLQRLDGSLCPAVIPIYLKKPPKRIKNARKPTLSTQVVSGKKITELKAVANGEALNIPASSNLRNSTRFDLDSFIENTYIPFIDEEIQEASGSGISTFFFHVRTKKAYNRHSRFY